MKKATIKKSTISGLLLTSVLLTGCGSSGGSGSSGITKPVFDATKTPVAKETGFDVSQGEYSSASSSIILGTQGSVIQLNAIGTNAIRTAVDGIAIDATKDALVSFKQIAGGQDVDISHSDNKYVYEPHTMAGVENVDTNAYAKSLTDGELSVVSNVANYGNGANDYLSYGAWAYQPTTGTAEEVGVYVNGGDAFTTANIAALTGTATYNGADGVAGLFRNTLTNEAETFVADVTLRANFGNNLVAGSIEGDINNVRFSKTVALNNDTNNSNNNGIEIELLTADIDADTGLWTGYTSTPNPFGGSAYTDGVWGGQFYGNGTTATDNPEWAAGTFGSGIFAGDGSSGSNSNSGQFIGTFIAKK